MIKVHLVADTVPLGTTFCQKVPGRSRERSWSAAGNRTDPNPATVLTYETAAGHMQLIPSRGHPHSTGIGRHQAWLALGILGQEGHHPLHWCPGYRGNTLCGLQQCLEETALVEDHVV